MSIPTNRPPRRKIPKLQPPKPLAPSPGHARENDTDEIDDTPVHLCAASIPFAVGDVLSTLRVTVHLRCGLGNAHAGPHEAIAADGRHVASWRDAAVVALPVREVSAFDLDALVGEGYARKVAGKAGR